MSGLGGGQELEDQVGSEEKRGGRGRQYGRDS